MTAIRKWHIAISGFLQNEGKPHGIVGIWRSLRQFAAPDCCVELRSWNDDWHALAELIYRCRPDSIQPAIQIYGYSWGGYSATVLAQELARRELRVDKMVLSDAVYRHSFWLGNWRALWPWSRIVIPSNVRDVTWYYQRKNSPAGHVLIPEDPKATYVRPGVKAPPHVGHSEMDDLTWFRSSVLTEAEAISA